MTRRERFQNTVHHQPVDRVVFDLFGSPQTMIDSPRVTERMAELLGISNPQCGNGWIDERILVALDIDTRMTGGFPEPPSPLCEQHEVGFTNCWGIQYQLINGHYEICKNPLKDMELDEIKQFPFPDAEKIDPAVYQQYAAHAKNLYENTDYVVCAQHPVYGVLELGCWMFGFDDFLYRLAGEPETVTWFFDKVLAYQKEIIRNYYGALGGYIHCTTSGDDFGTQRGLFMSVPMFQSLVAPYFKERIAYTKQFTTANYMHHTCGSVYELIPTLIDCGVELLNPIQPGAYMMEPERLKDHYGDQITFWGGVDTQDLLVNGTVEQVKQAVQKLIAIMEHNGGFVLSPAHCIQDDVPAENVIAIYEGAKEYYAR